MLMAAIVLILHLVAIRTYHITRDSECDSWAFIRIQAQVGELAF